MEKRHRAMLIALLIMLGVDLILIVVFVTIVLGRRRWLRRQPGVFPGAIRVTSGELEGIPLTWKRGTGRCVRDVLVWSKAPFMLRTELVPIDRVSAEREAHVGELKRLGNHPVVVQLVAGDVTIEVASRAEHRPDWWREGQTDTSSTDK